MSRLKADSLLLITTLIWGLAFVAQKSAMDTLGPFAFAGVRFMIASLVVLPFALRERHKPVKADRTDRWLIAAICCVFFGGVNLQQFGIIHTSVTNAGFLTSLYVILVPILSVFILKLRPHAIVWFCAPLSVLGVWLLGGATMTPPQSGDMLVILCAVCFAFHVALIGVVMQRWPKPLTLSAVQYLFCGVLSLLIALGVEDFDVSDLIITAPAILYTGVLSGGVAYTFQIIGQQYTPASDAAVILSGEALVAALGGVLILGERLDAVAWSGCGLIFTAILLVELFPLIMKRR